MTLVGAIGVVVGLRYLRQAPRAVLCNYPVIGAGLTHPRDITANHIVRRIDGDQVHLLANHLSVLKPGELFAAARGEAPWPHAVFAIYWPMARASVFAPASL